ncbi:MAG: OsmC family peroxiredoxin [Bacteroidetes bacterium]|nr:MAG: OsmC family peroxiredoxin [Bacteroidota bacterium]
MITSHIKYLGNLRTEATHVRSGNAFITDAPVDNHGKGEYFSPTDTVSSALGSCMLTLMGIAANAHQIELGEIEVDVTKHMASNPRRISRIDVSITFDRAYSDHDKKILEKAAITCPVAQSLHPDIEQVVAFTYKTA